MKKTKIVHLIMSFGAGGAETLIKNLSIRLAQNKNIEVEIWAIGESWSSKFEEDYIAEMNKNKIECIKLNKRNRKDYFKIVQSLRNLIKGRKVDVVNSHSELGTFYLIIASLFKKVKLIQTIHSIKINFPYSQKFFAKFFIDNWIAVAKIIEEELVNIIKVPTKKISVIYNGINLPPVTSTNSFKKYPEIIITIGRFVPLKNHIMLIKAYNSFLKKIDDESYLKPELILIGDGPLRNEIQEKIRELQLEDLIKLPGIVTDVRPYFKNADLFVLSSNWEGLPIVLIEAIAFGLPIISTNVGGIKEMIENKINGLLVEPDNEIALSEAFLKIYHDYNFRTFIANNNIKLRNKFDLELCYKKHLYVYQNYYNSPMQDKHWASTKIK